MGTIELVAAIFLIIGLFLFIGGFYKEESSIISIIGVILAVIGLILLALHTKLIYDAKENMEKEIALLDSKVEKQILILNTLDEKYTDDEEYRKQYIKEKEKLNQYIVDYNTKIRIYKAEDFPYDEDYKPYGVD